LSHSLRIRQFENQRCDPYQQGEAWFCSCFRHLDFIRSDLFRLEVIFVKDMLYALLALVAAIAAAYSFYTYTNSADDKTYLIIAIVCGLATVVLGGLFLSGRVNKKEDIHITE